MRWTEMFEWYQEAMEAFLLQRELVMLKNGCYTDAIREVYMDVMCVTVEAKNIVLHHRRK